MATKRKEAMIIEGCKLKGRSFTPLVFFANGGMGKECIQFHKRFAEIIADKLIE